MQYISRMLRAREEESKEGVPKKRISAYFPAFCLLIIPSHGKRLHLHGNSSRRSPRKVTRTNPPFHILQLKKKQSIHSIAERRERVEREREKGIATKKEKNGKRDCVAPHRIPGQQTFYIRTQSFLPNDFFLKTTCKFLAILFILSFIGLYLWRAFGMLVTIYK